MKPIEILKNEHRLIEQVLDCLQALARGCQKRGELNTRGARDMLDFFCQFADKLHHGKEEDHLFTAMESKGVPRDGGPTGVMLDEHEQGRIHIRGRVQALDSADTGNTTSIEAFTQHALAYVDLLRQHIQKEDHCLFPMANQALSDSEQQQLADSFAAASSDPAKAGLRDRFARLAAEVVNRF